MRRGRYTGTSGTKRLDLRIDTGVPDALDLVSGDLIGDVGTGGEHFLLSFAFEVHRLPQVAGIQAEASTEFESVVFGLQQQNDEHAQVDLTLKRRDGAPDEQYSFAVAWQGAEFRQIKVKPFVITGAKPPQSEDLEEVEPVSDGAPPPPIDVTGSFRRAGVDVILEAEEGLSVAGAGPDTFWSKTELAIAAADLARGSLTSTPGVWDVPLVVADRYETPNVLGIMFQPDIGNTIGRLAAVFFDEIRHHGKVEGDPVKFAREYLFTTVHELGHVLGLPHAWDALGDPPAPNRDASALTFMNYPDLYFIGYNRFYQAFQYGFLPEERRFLRHSPWADVWPGFRDTDEPDTFFRRVHPTLTLELRRPGGNRTTLGEPVQLEVKLENLSPRRVRVPIDVLKAEGGRLRAYVARLGRSPAVSRRFRPLAQIEFRAGYTYLGGSTPATGIPHTMYDVIDLTYGCDGCTFTEPGLYRVTVATEVSADFQVRSAPLTLEVREPPRRAASSARELLDPKLSRALVLGVDPTTEVCEHLSLVAGMTDLPGAAAVAAMRLGEAFGRAFKHPQRKAATPRDARRAAEWLGQAAEYSSKAASIPNPVHSVLLRLRAQSLWNAGQKDRGNRVYSSLLEFVDNTITSNARLRAQVRRNIHRTWRTFLRQGGEP